MLNSTGQHQNHGYYRRFCEAIIVERTQEGPYLTLCGEGYRNRGRKQHRNVPLCERHLKAEIARENGARHKHE